MTTYFLNDCEVERIPHDNSDLTVVNAARVSNAKYVHHIVTKNDPESLDRKDRGVGLDDSLINYLAKHNHFTPFTHVRFGFRFKVPDDFEWFPFLLWSGDDRATAGFNWTIGPDLYMHINGSLYGWLNNMPPLPSFVVNAVRVKIAMRCPLSFEALDGRSTNLEPWSGVDDMECDAFTFRIKAPIFVFRQLMRSNVGVTYNETSRRYVDDVPEMWEPEEWRKRPDKSIKQGSGKVVDDLTNARVDERCSLHCDQAGRLYLELLAMDVAPEMARMVLPQNMMTELWMTCTHSALRRILGLRLGEDGNNHPQAEIVELAKALKVESEKA